VPASSPPAPVAPDGDGHLKRGVLGTGSLVFMVVAAAAPLTVMAGVAPLAILVGASAPRSPTWRREWCSPSSRSPSPA
jgi:hypothetical protein